jgi:hypothetical protein
VCLPRQRVARFMMPGIPKFRKESHPERTKGNQDRFFTPSNGLPKDAKWVLTA